MENTSSFQFCDLRFKDSFIVWDPVELTAMVMPYIKEEPDFVWQHPMKNDCSREQDHAGHESVSFFVCV